MKSILNNSTKNKILNLAKNRQFSKTCQSSALNQYDTTLTNHTSLPLFDFFAQTKPTQSFTLSHGAAGFSKTRYNKEPIRKITSPVSVSAQVGEDAYFRRSDAIGVADGIGGWATTKGSDSALYSSLLMHYANTELDRFDDIEDPMFFEYQNTHPVDILTRSYDQSLKEAKKSNVLGSTTACLAVLREDQLRVANIGDCGISIIRNNHYLFRSEEQQHAFNFPYQLGLTSRDKPQHAQSFTIQVQKGDIIIMGTDGLYDNMFDKHILELVREHVTAHTIPATEYRPARVGNLQPQLLSDILANAAKEISETKHKVDTPFQRRAMKEGLFMEGGKPDDISVVVAIVKDCEDSPDRRL